MRECLFSVLLLFAVAVACGGGNVARFAPCTSTDTCPSSTTCEAASASSSSGATFCTWSCNPGTETAGPNGQSCPNDANGVQGVCIGDVEASFGFCFQDCSSGAACPDGETCQQAGEFMGDQSGTMAMVCVPTPNDALSGTTWQSTTIAPTASSNGITMLSYTMTFGTTNGTMAGFASGPFSATLTQTYDESAPQFNGCTETTTFSGGTWADEPPTQEAAGSLVVNDVMGSTNRTGCNASGDDVTGEMGDYDGAVNSTQGAPYTISGTTMTLHGGEGVTPYTDDVAWTFTKM